MEEQTDKSVSTDAISEMQSQLVEMIASMDLPLMRKDISDPLNLRWLQRNMGIRNLQHPDFHNAMAAVAWLLRNA